MTLRRPSIALALALVASSAIAQKPPVVKKVTGGSQPLDTPQVVQFQLPREPAGVHPPFTVKTVTLHHLSSGQAVKLLSPYSVTVGGGVFEVPGLEAVTIREVPAVYDQMLDVLEKYDREPATVVLNFQLVSAEQTNTRDPAVAGIDSLLRGVLKFSGYRLLGTAVATVGEDRGVEQTLAGDTETLGLNVSVREVRVEGNSASVNLIVELYKPAIPAGLNVVGRGPITLLQTGVTVPIGQTVLLGTSASDNGQRALILTVRPQLAKR